MYRLLLATDRRDVQETIAAIDSWESMGFRKPRMADNAAAAIECLQNHRVDALAMAMDSKEEKALYSTLQAEYPNLPIFLLTPNKDEQIAILNEVRVLLNRLHADFSDDDYGIGELMNLTRNEFMHALLSEQVESPREVEVTMKLLRCAIEMDKPCVLVELELPAGDEYLAGRWHYGSERLEVALRNFFGTSLNGLFLGLAVVSPHTIRLLACPLEMGETEEKADSFTNLVMDHVQEAIGQIREYLDLEMRLCNIGILENIAMLAVQR